MQATGDGELLNEVLRDLSVESQQYNDQEFYDRTCENIRFVEDGGWFSTLYVDRLESTTNSPHLKKILRRMARGHLFFVGHVLG
jgi:hypothetical protein